VNKTK